MADPEAQLDTIDAGLLAPIVRQALSREGASVSDWSCTPLAHSAINPVTAGLYRVAGTACDGAERLRWSVILKIIHWVDLSGTPFAHDYMNAPGDWNYWKREALVFQSGLLDGWQGDLVPVQCYAVSEQADGSIWLWLEHVQDLPGADWELERHLLAARHFGQFGGAHCGTRRVPDAPWLCRRFVRQWLRTNLAFGLLDILGDAAFWAHPHVQRAFPSPVAARAAALVDDRERLLACLERQPHTLAHLDSHYSNLFDRQAHRGQAQTVVIDWSFAGLAAVGEDLGMQISGTLFDLRVNPTAAGAYYEAALDAYLAGLRDAGWRGSAEAVRFASAAAAALRLVPFGLEMLRELIHAPPEESWAGHLAQQQGCTAEEAVGRRGRAITFLLDLGDEARHLADRV